MRLSSSSLVLLALILGVLVNAIIIPADPAADCSVKILEAFTQEETMIQLVESVKQVPKNARRYRHNVQALLLTMTAIPSVLLLQYRLSFQEFTEVAGIGDECPGGVRCAAD
jgi:hypothetical protein